MLIGLADEEKLDRLFVRPGAASDVAPEVREPDVREDMVTARKTHRDDVIKSRRQGVGPCAATRRGCR